MKVLFLTRLYYPHIGGVEKHVFEISKRLVAIGHDVTIVTEELGGEYHIFAKTSGKETTIKVIRIPVGKDNWFKKFRIWKWFFQNQDILKNADIIHCHDVFFWYLPFRFLYPFKKVYTTFHGYETIFPPKKSAIRIRRISDKLSLGTICVGDYIKKWYGTKPDYIIYGGISEIKKENVVVKQILSQLAKVLKKDEKLKIIFIGRIDEDNGISIYLRTLDKLRENSIPFKLNFFGDGSLKNNAKKYGIVHGFIDDIFLQIKKSDIVFASSYLSILESLAQKKLVFSVHTNELKKDYLEMSPFSKNIICVNSPEDLYENIKKYSDNPEKKNEMVEKGYDWVKDQTWDNVTNIYLTLWKVNN